MKHKKYNGLTHKLDCRSVIGNHYIFNTTKKELSSFGQYDHPLHNLMITFFILLFFLFIFTIF